jgi:uncharacterized membrane protein
VPSPRNAMPLWRIPIFYIVGSVALGLIFPRLETEHLGAFTRGMAASAAMAFFSAISSGMLALTGIGLAVAFLFLQLSASAYSIRLFTIFASRPALFHTLGAFFATFTYALAALIWTDHNDSGSAPLFSTYIVGALLIFSMLRFSTLIYSLRDLQIQQVLQSIGDSGRAAIRAAFPDAAEEPQGAHLGTEGLLPDAAELGPAAQTFVHRGAPRSITGVDFEALAALAGQSSAVVALAFGIGDTVIEPSVLMRVHGGVVPKPALRRAVRLSPSRTLDQDPKYALRLLVDIAIRALSPSVNDPTTAVQALDQIEDLMRRLVRLQIERRVVRDAAGAVRVLFPASTWDDYLSLAFDEIRQFGAASIQVDRRLRTALQDLIAVAPIEARRAAVRRYLDHLEHGLDRAPFDDQDRATARAVDWQGLGLSR